MNVEQIIKLLNQQTKKNIEADSLITGVTDDSRDVEEGYVFVAVRGYQVDGHDFIEEAIQKGAAVVVTEDEVEHEGAVCLQTENSRKALGQIAAAFYGHPSEDKIVIGVTGTNGKTTTSHMIKHLCEKNGYSCGMFGTIDYVVNDKVVPGIQTTPSAPLLQKLLYESKDDVVVMEVSSHGLAQYRLEGVTFDYAVFTNLYKDHLDYHDSMESYFEAKSKLFHMLKPGGKSVINTDDSWGEKLAHLLEEKGTSVCKVGHHLDHEIVLKDIDTDDFTACIHYDGEDRKVTSPLKGTHNVYNTLEAFAVGLQLGISFSDMEKAMTSLPGIRGRFELIEFEDGPTVVVDYAHTADSIEHVLDTARQQGAASLTHVFGFRGDRDISKRGEMIGASAIRADHYILTLDDLNTATFDGMVSTLEDLQKEFGDSSGRIIPDRTLAIEEAIMNSGTEDWVVITGKGHESYQQKYHYPVNSDKEMVEDMKQKLKSVKKDMMA
ncbi:UDP-N-acetylmuramoyl-L-alanyl-D-glutamate--2,6-diaminopimelate ligase [Halobacillus sp. Nhm2S1]|uniref:UDP-N-acetylmuramoyl-L-alanyl-D-glutamate--2, 6-diaminopimelate ligase n=1 Tax=Halobacillus sp. Nhm2S1 TaxID=2866716 RepID=UPI001C734C99|nr:UDP-N-acetylmuramoyl-L-alanyl-D-glutamate--2,6-diaminopimelate ligase [Halobacillus sp. Nhm2S1]MBX0356123.1 UDP-N-acetylmuramoyl-L-alanyl-D-glutamate--2,6-diaminopimelate ligase [Halobacillus sp. Nhm2S1]